MRRTLTFIPVLIALVLAPVGAAQAAVGWSPPRTVGSAQTGASDPIAATDAHGRATAAWLVDQNGSKLVRAAAETTPGSFDVAQTLSASGETDVKLAGVISDANGAGLVVWCSKLDGVPVIRASDRPAGSAFGVAQTLAGSAVGSCADVAINANGDVAIAWQSNLRAMLLTRRQGGSFGSAESVTAPSQVAASAPAVAVGPSGVVHLVWASRASASDSAFRIGYAIRPVSGPLGPGVLVSPTYHGNLIALDAAADASAAAVWHEPVPGTAGRILVARGSAIAGLPEPTQVAAPAGTDQRLDVGAAADLLYAGSDATVDAAGDPNFCGSRFAFARSAGPSTDLSAVAIPATPETDSPAVAHSGVNAVVAWRQFTRNDEACQPLASPTSSIRVTARATDTDFGAPVDISDPRFPAADPSVSGSNQLVAAWTCFDGRRTRVQVATYVGEAGTPQWCGAEDLNPPKVKLKRVSRYPVRWRTASKPSPTASCHEQCLVTVGVLLFSARHRAQKLGFSEKMLKPNATKRLPFPKLSRGTQRSIKRAISRRYNVRLVYRLRFDDLAGNSVLKTTRVRLRR